MKELSIEDSIEYEDMMRMSHFKRILNYIESDSTLVQTGPLGETK